MSSTVFLKEDIVKKCKLFIVIISHIHRQSTTAVAYPGDNNSVCIPVKMHNANLSRFPGVE